MDIMLIFVTQKGTSDEFCSLGSRILPVALEIRSEVRVVLKGLCKYLSVVKVAGVLGLFS